MAQVETEQRHAAQAIHDALGVRLFKHPPEGFDAAAGGRQRAPRLRVPGEARQGAASGAARDVEAHGVASAHDHRAAVRAADGQAARHAQHDGERHLDQLVRGGLVRREGGLGDLRHRAVDGAGRRRARPRQLLLRELGRHRRRRLGRRVASGNRVRHRLVRVLRCQADLCVVGVVPELRGADRELPGHVR